MLYPQQNDKRNLLDLSGIWDFQIDPEEVGIAERWFNGLSEPRAMAVPSSWNELYDDLHDYMGTGWYVTNTYVPATWQGERIMLRIGSANYAATVWVNGHEIGSHEGGHLPFEFDVTSSVSWDAQNTIAIRVENHLKPERVPAGNVQSGIGGFMRMFPAATFDFFPYCGLHRAVQLYSVPQINISDITVTTDIHGSTGVVTVAVVATDADGCALQLVGNGFSATAAVALNEGKGQGQFEVPDVRLWSSEDPFLYELTVSIADGDSGSRGADDRYSLPVGIRTVTVDGDKLLLNGEPIFLKGFGKHEDFAVAGRGHLTPLVVKDYALLKWIGANSYRTAHYPYSEEQMMMADREGILIMN